MDTSPKWTPVRVVNRYHHPHQPDIISVQRPTPLGNPWRAGPDGTREEVLGWYFTWLENHYQNRTGPVYAELVRLARINPLTISCTCLPRPCHATIVAQFIERVRTDGIPPESPTVNDGF